MWILTDLPGCKIMSKKSSLTALRGLKQFVSYKLSTQRLLHFVRNYKYNWILRYTLIYLVSALYFRGKQTMAPDDMDSYIFDDVIKKAGYRASSQTQGNLHVQSLRIGRVFKYICCVMESSIKFLPLKAFHNLRMARCILFKDEKYRLQGFQTVTFLWCKDPVNHHRRWPPCRDVPCRGCYEPFPGAQKDVS
jgi:hypothetical protein